jgi:hypothetical protein
VDEFEYLLLFLNLHEVVDAFLLCCDVGQPELPLLDAILQTRQGECLDSNALRNLAQISIEERVL